MHGRAQNICSDCSKQMSGATRLCFWCGRHYVDSGDQKSAWDPEPDECSDMLVATAVGPRKPPKPEAEGGDQRAQGRELDELMGDGGGSSVEKKAEWFEKLKAKGLIGKTVTPGE